MIDGRRGLGGWKEDILVFSNILLFSQLVELVSIMREWVNVLLKKEKFSLLLCNLLLLLFPFAFIVSFHTWSLTIIICLPTIDNL